VSVRPVGLGCGWIGGQGFNGAYLRYVGYTSAWLEKTEMTLLQMGLL
jgi:hypothetical protein